MPINSGHIHVPNALPKELKMQRSKPSAMHQSRDRENPQEFTSVLVTLLIGTEGEGPL